MTANNETTWYHADEFAGLSVDNADADNKNPLAHLCEAVHDGDGTWWITIDAGQYVRALADDMWINDYSQLLELDDEHTVALTDLMTMQRDEAERYLYFAIQRASRRVLEQELSGDRLLAVIEDYIPDDVAREYGITGMMISLACTTFLIDLLDVIAWWEEERINYF